MNYRWLLQSFLICNSTLAQSIFVIGDSHANFCFTNKLDLVPHTLRPFYSDTYSFTKDNFVKSIPITIIWIPNKTMHAVGRDGLGILNFKKYPIASKDIIVLLFGEIDCRNHICKQRDRYNRTFTEILDTLVYHYGATIAKNMQNFPDCICVICSVVPPRAGGYQQNPAVPIYGSVADRIKVAQQLNQRLKALCQKHDWLFLDIYSLYANAQGALDERWADSSVHISPVNNHAIKNKLINLLLDHKLIS